MTTKPHPNSPAENSPPEIFDVAIIGAGMVGGALACDLARRGARVALIEKKLPCPFEATAKPDIRVSSINIASETYLTNLRAWPLIVAMRTRPYQRLAVWERLSPAFDQWLPHAARQTEFSAASMGFTHLGHIIENQVIQLALQEVWEQQEKVTCFAGSTLKRWKATDKQRSYY